MMKHASRLLILIAMMTPVALKAAGPDHVITPVAVKSNMLHDALLTPDLGIELGINRNASVAVEGVWAWWSRERSHRCWRICGAWLEGRYWFGPRSDSRGLTGHHIGAYMSMHTYDFEFGGKGWQSPGLTMGVGVSYGYSFRVADRLNIDVGARLGYSGGNVTTYRPQCGEYVCVSRGHHSYFGPTDVAVTLVWFPGRGNSNHPDR